MSITFVYFCFTVFHYIDIGSSGATDCQDWCHSAPDPIKTHGPVSLSLNFQAPILPRKAEVLGRISLLETYNSSLQKRKKQTFFLLQLSHFVSISFTLNFQNKNFLMFNFKINYNYGDNVTFLVLFPKIPPKKTKQEK